MLLLQMNARRVWGQQLVAYCCAVYCCAVYCGACIHATHVDEPFMSWWEVQQLQLVSGMHALCMQEMPLMQPAHVVHVVDDE